MNKFAFLPTTKQEMKQRGWKQLDIILINGDAYVDHPSFGIAIIGRWLEKHGFRVGIIDQPNWRTDDDFLRLGRPTLFFGISSGSMDSIVNHYTAQKKIRSKDAYSPDGKTGFRPNYAALVYTQKIKQNWKNVPVVLGGVEASLRRIPHYDFYSEKLKNSILLDSKADIITYGMAEKTILDIAFQLKKTGEIDKKELKGIVYRTAHNVDNVPIFADFDVLKRKENYRDFFYHFTRDSKQKTIWIRSGSQFLVHNPASPALTTAEMDAIYDLPFQRDIHPKYKKNKIPAFEQIKVSITAHRGCTGGCSFCAIGYHQGKAIQSRSHASIKKEVESLTQKPYFKGTISDVGGPSANNYGMFCKKGLAEICSRESCLYPEICPNLNTSHSAYLKLLKELKENGKVRHLFIASGVRFDLAILDKQFMHDLSNNYTGGLLKVAPEHCSKNVLKKMRKPTNEVYKKFSQEFKKISESLNKNQFIIPYIIVGHPGATLHDTLELALFLKKENLKLRQVQEFTPTPMTASTCMYYTGKDYETGKQIHIPKGREIRQMKSLVQWFLPESKRYVIEALKKINKINLLSVFYPVKENVSFSKTNSKKINNKFKKKKHRHKK